MATKVPLKSVNLHPETHKAATELAEHLTKHLYRVTGSNKTMGKPDAISYALMVEKNDRDHFREMLEALSAARALITEELPGASPDGVLKLLNDCLAQFGRESYPLPKRSPRETGGMQVWKSW
jgi:hypothetical protein